MSARKILLMITMAASVATASATVAAQRGKPQTAPEEFTSAMQARTATAASAATIHIRIERYTPEGDRKAMTDALTIGGYSGLLQALRKAPVVGQIEIGGQMFPVRWAREQATPKGRSISLGTDAPIYFVGGGGVNAKPRAGFEVAMVQLAVDEFGLGTGTMAAAARVKPDGQGGVVVEDYADEPIKLTYVHRVIK